MGGTFNPIHIGHLAIAQEALEFKKLDNIIFIPTGIPPHKKGEIISGEKRLEMIKLATDDNNNFLTSDYEIKKETKSYSVETVKYLKKIYNMNEIYFIMGEDSFLDIESWHRYEEFLFEAKVLVAKRSIENQEILHEKINRFNLKGYSVEEIPVSFLEISSTKIRDKFKIGENPKYYLESSSFEYIQKEGLYV